LLADKFLEAVKPRARSNTRAMIYGNAARLRLSNCQSASHPAARGSCRVIEQSRARATLILLKFEIFLYFSIQS
jgi:hypothetical protein